MSRRADTRTASLPLPTTGEAITPRDVLALTPELARDYSYEQAMANPAIRICLANTAEAMNRARQQGSHA